MDELNERINSIYDRKKSLESALMFLEKLETGSVEVCMANSFSSEVRLQKDSFKDGYIKERRASFQSELEDIEDRIFRSKKILEGYGKS